MKSDSSFESRYGALTRSGGRIAAIPTAIFRYQAKLGLTAAETWLITVLLSYRWTKRAPYPSLNRLSRDSGIPRSTIQSYVSSLREKGYLVVEHRRAADNSLSSNAYFLEPLLLRLVELVHEDPANEEEDDEASQPPRRVYDPPDTPSRSAGHPYPVVRTPYPVHRQEVDTHEQDPIEVEEVSQPRFRSLSYEVAAIVGLRGNAAADVGDRLEDLADLHGTSEKELARAISCARELTSGTRNPTLDNVMSAIETALESFRRPAPEQ